MADRGRAVDLVGLRVSSIGYVMYTHIYGDSEPD